DNSIDDGFVDRRALRGARDQATISEIVFVTWMQCQKWMAGIVVLSAVDERLVSTDDFGHVTADQPRRAFVFGNPEEIRIARKQRVGEIPKARPRDHVLVDRDVTEVSKANE